MPTEEEERNANLFFASFFHDRLELENNYHRLAMASRTIFKSSIALWASCLWPIPSPSRAKRSPTKGKQESLAFVILFWWNQEKSNPTSWPLPPQLDHDTLAACHSSTKSERKCTTCNKRQLAHRWHPTTSHTLFICFPIETGFIVGQKERDASV